MALTLTSAYSQKIYALLQAHEAEDNMKIELEETYSMVVLVACGVAIWGGVALLAVSLIRRGIVN